MSATVTDIRIARARRNLPFSQHALARIAQEMDAWVHTCVRHGSTGVRLIPKGRACPWCDATEPQPPKDAA